MLSSSKQLSQRLCVGAWRSFSSIGKEPYWRAKFPDGVESFDKIPIVDDRYDPRKIHEVAEGWFKKHGHVVKEPYNHFGRYNVHLFHFDDFRTVYQSDGDFPIRQSHQIIAHYRGERKDLYDHIGLGPGQGEEWRHLREMVVGKPFALRPSKEKSEDAANDLVEIIRNNLNDKGEIDLLPWLNRFAFESIGIVALNRRLNALDNANELADKMVAAGALTDEMIALTTMDPLTMYDERFKLLEGAQDFFYSVIRKYVDDIKRDIELEPETEGVAQILLQGDSCTENDAITLVIDLFHGALQTVPLTALMAFHNVACNGDIQAKAREEIKQRMPRKDSKLFDVTGPKDFTEAILYETLRLNPPIIGNGRVIQKDLVLGGYSVPSFTNVILHFQVACRQEENFKDPLKFIPGRADNHRVNYIFGGSKRMCLGRAFAVRQLLLAVSKVIRNFEISYDGGEINTINQLHNRPDKPLILRLKPIDE